MDKKRERGINFTVNETDLLMKCILEEMKVIENKKTDGTTTKDKQLAWERIKNSFNTRNIDVADRDINSLKNKYDNIKRNLKKKVATNKYNYSATGGGPHTEVKFSWYEEQLFSALQLGITGLNSVGDSDQVNVSVIKELEPFVTTKSVVAAPDETNSQNSVMTYEVVQSLSPSGTNQYILSELEYDYEKDTRQKSDEQSDTLLEQSFPLTKNNFPSTAKSNVSTTNKWNLKNKKKTSTQNEKQVNLNAFGELAENKIELVNVQKKSYDEEYQLKIKQQKICEEEWNIKKQILETELNTKKEQLNTIIEDRKRQEVVHDLICEEKKLKIQILKYELNQKFQMNL